MTAIGPDLPPLNTTLRNCLRGRFFYVLLNGIIPVKTRPKPRLLIVGNPSHRPIPPCSCDLREVVFLAQLGPKRRADGIRQLLLRLLMNQIEYQVKSDRIEITVPSKRLASLPNMRRYSLRTIRSWRKWAVERGVLRVQFAESGEWCGNSYVVDLLRIQQLATSNAGKA
jgi:hypothetical protein